LIEVSRPKAIILDTDLNESWDVSVVETVLGIDIQKRAGILRRLFTKEPVDSDTATYPLILSNFEAGKLPSHIDPESDAYILFTSGTTNASKGVRISHRALCAHLDTLSKVYGYTPESRILNILLLSHADGIIQGPVVTFFNSAQLFNPFRFVIPKITDLLDTIYHHRISHFICVPTMLALILRFASEEKDAFNTNDFKLIGSCGAQLEPDLWQSFETNFGVSIVNVYGLTETVVGGIFAGPDMESHVIGTIGKPVDCEARIVNENGFDVPPGEAGELWLRGNNIMSGYFGDPEATADVFSGEWFKTGDIACCNTEGIYRIIGRKKEIIISGGVNIHPEEITEVLNKHPQVTEAVTFGLPDHDWGEKVVSAVVVIDQTVGEEELINFCRDNLEEVKVPDNIAILETLPRGRSGKVQIKVIKEHFLNSKKNVASARLDIEQRIIGIAANCFKVSAESLSIDDTVDTTIGWDSLSHLELIVTLEETFAIKFSPSDIMQMNSLETVLTTVQKNI
jgi:long-chain acyl-CoA synthetase